MNRPTWARTHAGESKPKDRDRRPLRRLREAERTGEWIMVEINADAVRHIIMPKAPSCAPGQTEGS